MPVNNRVIHRGRAADHGERHSAMAQSWAIPQDDKAVRGYAKGAAVATVAPGKCAPGEGPHALSSGKVRRDPSKAKTGGGAGLARGLDEIEKRFSISSDKSVLTLSSLTYRPQTRMVNGFRCFVLSVRSVLRR